MLAYLLTKRLVTALNKNGEGGILEILDCACSMSLSVKGDADTNDEVEAK